MSYILYKRCIALLIYKKFNCFFLYSESCWCANQYNKEANISFSNCQTPCDYLDTNRQFCGGVNSTAIYKTLINIITHLYVLFKPFLKI
jgi:hypothetical protein